MLNRIKLKMNIYHVKRLLLAVLAAALILASLPLSEIEVSAETEYTVINVTASDIAASSAYSAIQAALNTAKTNATSDNMYKVIVESGSYELGSSLRIYSNTYLDVQGVTFTQTSGAVSNMIKVGDSPDTQAGYYYTNITVYGGVWDGNSNSNTMVKICHAKNFTLSNAVVKNSLNSHLMEVAGVDGLTVECCEFRDQVLNNEEDATLTYEAIQLDILVDGHISGYLYEDIANKNITITSCTFDNVPRGVGSHTAVLNNPIDTITITDNTFTNIKSCAVQLTGCKNVTISSNTITDSPRGIAIYSCQLKGTYLSTTLAEEGGISSSTPTTYQTPSAANVVVSDNNITVSGSDIYASYERVGIYLSGLLLEKAAADSGDELPAGDYYLTGVTVSNNTVKSIGHGIRLNNVRAAKITGNTLTYNGTSGDTNYAISLRTNSQASSISSNNATSYYRGIFLLESSATSVSSNTIKSAYNNGVSLQGATVTSITSNTINSAGNNGIYVYYSSSVGSINNNSITSAAKYGIGIDNASATKINSNTIKNSSNNSINLINSSKAGYINSNIISSAGKNAIYVQCSKVTSAIESNTISTPANNGIYIYNSGSAAKISKNTITSAGKYGIDVQKATATKISGNTVSKSKNIGIAVLDGAKVQTISDNTVKNGSSRGISISSLKCAMTVSGNTISGCTGDVLLLCNPSTTSYTIKITGNKITGSSSKKSAGIKVSSGNVTLKSNSVKSCNAGILLSTSARGTIYGNTLKSNKSNKLTIGSKKYSFLSTPSLSVAKKTKTSIKLKWKKISGADKYIIYRSTSKSGTYKKCAAVSGSKMTYTNKSLKSGKKYYYKIVAYRTVGKYKIYSSNSSVRSAKTK